jgi:hypothetical protein
MWWRQLVVDHPAGNHLVLVADARHGGGDAAGGRRGLPVGGLCASDRQVRAVPGAFPQDPNVSLARVKISTGRMWQTVEGSRDKTQALETAKQELPLIENEAAFAQMRPELASILPEIADGFASQARGQTDMQRAQELVSLAEEAMQLIDNPTYVPTSQRKTIETKLARINENIELANRNINMSQAAGGSASERCARQAEAGNTVEAFRIRHVLLNGQRDEDGKLEIAGYPELSTNKELIEATRFITDRERELVKISDQPIEAETDDHPQPSLYPVALASRHGSGQRGQREPCDQRAGARRGLRAECVRAASCCGGGSSATRR